MSIAKKTNRNFFISFVIQMNSSSSVVVSVPPVVTYKNNNKKQEKRKRQRQKQKQEKQLKREAEEAKQKREAKQVEQAHQNLKLRKQLYQFRRRGDMDGLRSLLDASLDPASEQKQHLQQAALKETEQTAMNKLAKLLSPLGIKPNEVVQHVQKAVESGEVDPTNTDALFPLVTEYILKHRNKQTSKNTLPPSSFSVPAALLPAVANVPPIPSAQPVAPRPSALPVLSRPPPPVPPVSSSVVSSVPPVSSSAAPVSSSVSSVPPGSSSVV
jgi:multidrug efflux pump subunit AcrB